MIVKVEVRVFLSRDYRDLLGSLDGDELMANAEEYHVKSIKTYALASYVISAVADENLECVAFAKYESETGTNETETEHSTDLEEALAWFR